MILVLIFGLVCFREYEGLVGETISPLYDNAWVGFRWVDLIVLALVYVHALWVLKTRQPLPRLPRGLKVSVLLIMAAIAFSVLYGFYQGGEHLYFDWRDVLLATGLAFVFSCWIHTASALDQAIQVFAWIMSARILYLLGNYFLGGGVEGVVPGLITPVYDGPTIDGAVLLFLLAYRFVPQETRQIRRMFWIITGLSAFLLVALSLRRTFWGEMIIAIVVLALLQKNKQSLWVLILLCALLAAYSGKRMFLRAESMNPFAENTPYTMTNQDHVGDVLDALDVVKAHPLLGIGLGHAYRTQRITMWKVESWQVHNGPLHAWVFYGFLGLMAEFAFHLNLFGWLKEFQATESDLLVRDFCQVGLAYVAGQFGVSCAFSPWPYGQFQCDILIFFVIGSLLSLERTRAWRVS